MLIVGATSAVGLLAIQLAKSLGASTVIATTTNDAKKPALQHAGADVTINTRSDNLVDAAQSATDGRGADIVLDHVGGDVFASLPMSTAIGETIVNVGRLGGKGARVDLDHVAFRRIHIIGTTFSVRGVNDVTAVVAALAPIVAGPVADGLIRPVVDRTYDLENAVDAAQRMRSDKATGKIVLTVADQQRPQP